MDLSEYISVFKKAGAHLNKDLLRKKGLLLITGTWLDSAVLKMQKKNWSNHPGAGPQAGSGIFFFV